MKIIVLLVCSLLCSLLTSSVFEAFAALEDDLRNTAILTRQNMRTTPRTYVRHGNGNRKKDIISLRNATATTVPFPDLFAGRIIGLESAQHFEIERYSIRGSAKKSSYLQNMIYSTIEKIVYRSALKMKELSQKGTIDYVLIKASRSANKISEWN